MYCGIHVYEKLDGISAWLLGFIALRELLSPCQSCARPAPGEPGETAHAGWHSWGCAINAWSGSHPLTVQTGWMPRSVPNSLTASRSARDATGSNAKAFGSQPSPSSRHWWIPLSTVWQPWHSAPVPGGALQRIMRIEKPLGDSPYSHARLLTGYAKS